MPPPEKDFPFLIVTEFRVAVTPVATLTTVPVAFPSRMAGPTSFTFFPSVKSPVQVPVTMMIESGGALFSAVCRFCAGQLTAMAADAEGATAAPPKLATTATTAATARRAPRTCRNIWSLPPSAPAEGRQFLTNTGPREGMISAEYGPGDGHHRADDAGTPRRRR